MKPTCIFAIVKSAEAVLLRSRPETTYGSLRLSLLHLLLNPSLGHSIARLHDRERQKRRDARRERDKLPCHRPFCLVKDQSGYQRAGDQRPQKPSCPVTKVLRLDEENGQQSAGQSPDQLRDQSQIFYAHLCCQECDVLGARAVCRAVGR